jgi:predicted DCC family thiol-disulfide oxidoreductase YuxK
MAAWRLKLLYDGQCPFCRQEVAWLKWWDTKNRLALEDITDPAFDPGRYGLTEEEAMGIIHGILPDGRVVRRVEALRQAYEAVGLGWMVAPTRLPVINWLTDKMYGAFARNRVWLGRLFGRRCDDNTCAVHKTMAAKKN